MVQWVFEGPDADIFIMNPFCKSALDADLTKGITHKT